jgi:polyisoprenoid-binding protein YceI
VIADGTWSIDAARSRIGFVASHVFGLGRVTGSFSDFSGQITTLAGAIASAQVTIGTDSISTGNDRRDTDLRSPAFLDVESHAEISYATTEVEHEGDGRYRIVGTLTARGTSAEVPLNAKLVDASDGALRARALATFNRRALGITPGARSLVVGRLVGVEIEVLAARGE